MSIPNYKFQGTKQSLHFSVNTYTDPDHLSDSFLHQGYDEEDEDDDDDEEELIRAVLGLKYPSGLSACLDGLRADHQKQKYEQLDEKVRKTFSMRAEQDEKQSSSMVERAVRRAFSMRASSSSASINQVYRRIDHQYDPVDPDGDEEMKRKMVHTEIESDKKRNSNKILEACRRFFGF
ncbi:hypothetical protein DITRI_Ditri14bG0046400 [Diplodiscus trichospermus]